MKPYLRVTLLYLLFGLCWIFLSDWMLATVFPGAGDELTQWQTLKGSLYIAVSAVLVYLLSKFAYQSQERREMEKKELFQATVRASHHIVLNFLNQIQVLKLTAEEHHDFDKEVIRLCEEVTRESTEKLLVLGRLEKASVEEIGRIAYGECAPSALEPRRARGDEASKRQRSDSDGAS